MITIRHRSRMVKVPDISMSDIVTFDPLHQPDVHAVTQRAYRAGVVACLEALESTAGARNEAALMGCGMGDGRRDATPEERANRTEALREAISEKPIGEPSISEQATREIHTLAANACGSKYIASKRF